MPPKGQVHGHPDALATAKESCLRAAPDAAWSPDKWGYTTTVNGTRIRVTSCRVTATRGKVRVSAKVAQQPHLLEKRIAEAIEAAQETP